MSEAGINRGRDNINVVRDTITKKTPFTSEFTFFLLQSITDKGIEELKANPHWVDQGSNDPFSLFFMIIGVGGANSVRTNLIRSVFLFFSQLF